MQPKLVGPVHVPDDPKSVIEDVYYKGENPFMRMYNRCITYADFIYVRFSTFNVLKVFAVVQRGRHVNLII